VVRYGKLFSAFGLFKRWSGIVKDRAATVASATRPASSGAGTHMPIPYTGTAASTIRCGCWGTNELVYAGAAAGSAKLGCTANGSACFQSPVATASVAPESAATGGQVFRGGCVSAVLPASAGRGTGPAKVIGKMRYIRYRPGPLAGKGAAS
jgi:hypothetical protein